MDNNVLISAFRSDLEQHAIAKSWLEDSLAAVHALRLFPTVEAGFLRVVTNPKVFNPPSPLAEAWGFLRALSEAPSVEAISWTPACRKRWAGLCIDLGLSGNDCNDAMLAAVALEKGLRVVTFDKNFQRFPGLRLELLGA